MVHELKNKEGCVFKYKWLRKSALPLCVNNISCPCDSPSYALIALFDQAGVTQGARTVGNQRVNLSLEESESQASTIIYLGGPVPGRVIIEKHSHPCQDPALNCLLFFSEYVKTNRFQQLQG